MHATNPPTGLSEPEKPARPRYRVLTVIPYTLKSFGVLLGLHFLIGALEFAPLGLAAMWVNLLSLLTIVAALLVFLDLYRTRRASSEAAASSAALVLRWEALLFASELAYGFCFGHSDSHLNSAMVLFHEQSPWIWMTYGVLPISGTVGCSVYLLYRNRRKV